MSRPDPRSILILASPRDRGAVTAARALRRAGWRVEAGSPESGGGLLGASRTVERVHPVPRPRGDGRDFVDALNRAHRAGGHHLAIGAGDDWASALSHYRERLTATVAHPPARAVERSGDKLLLARYAEEAGLATPVTRPATPAAMAALGPGDFPVVVKNRHHWHPGQDRTFRVETRICDSPDELAEHVAGMTADGDEPLLQDHRRGQLAALIGLFHDGRLTGRVQQVATRVWPTPAGASARARTVPVDEALTAASERLLGRLEWEGLVELQFLIDDDGTHRLIDLNGRYFGSLALSEHARPGLVDASARQAAGLEVPRLADGRAGVQYQWLPGDLRRAIRERRRGPLDVAGTLARSLRSRHSVFSWSDPGPTFTLLGLRRGERTCRRRPVSRPGRAAPAAAAASRRSHG